VSDHPSSTSFRDPRGALPIAGRRALRIVTAAGVT
jgi:hypothetical protein